MRALSALHMAPRLGSVRPFRYVLVQRACSNLLAIVLDLYSIFGYEVLQSFSSLF